MYVYLIQKGDSNHYKIGITHKVNQRVKSLQTASSESLKIIHIFSTNFNRKLESYLHRYFKSKQLSGEWFSLEELEVNTFLEICDKAENNFKLLKDQNTWYQNKHQQD